MSPHTGKRVAIVTNIPRPYRVPLFEALSRHISQAGGQLRVYYYSDPQQHRRRQGSRVAQGDFASATVNSLDIHLGYERVISIPIRLFPALRAFRPDVVICGAFGLPGYLTWLYTRAARVPYIQWSGATLVRQGRGIGLRTQRFLARRAHACVSYGTSASTYLVSLGAAPQRVVKGINAVDTAFFMQKSRQAQAEAIELRTSRGLTGTNLLCVGNLVPPKGIGYVLQALSRLSNDASDFHLHLVGAGPAEGELRQQAEVLGIGARVHFWGAQPADRVPLYYALADVFIFPSVYDVWGLVLNEAMACGLPVISSPLAGATQDLVEDGVNGLVVDPRDIEELTSALAALITDRRRRTQFGQAACATIQSKATIEHSARAFLNAIQMVVR